MARNIIALQVCWDEADAEAFERHVTAIIRKYGDHPHTRRRRDAELERAARILGSCVYLREVHVDG